MSKSLDLLKKQREQLNAKILKLEASQKSKERKEDTRRKILVGHYFMEEAKKAGTLGDLFKKLSVYVTREIDKKLFEE